MIAAKNKLAAPVATTHVRPVPALHRTRIAQVQGEESRRVKKMLWFCNCYSMFFRPSALKMFIQHEYSAEGPRQSMAQRSGTDADCRTTPAVCRSANAESGVKLKGLQPLPRLRIDGNVSVLHEELDQRETHGGQNVDALPQAPPIQRRSTSLRMKLSKAVEDVLNKVQHARFVPLLVALFTAKSTFWT